MQRKTRVLRGTDNDNPMPVETDARTDATESVPKAIKGKGNLYPQAPDYSTITKSEIFKKYPYLINLDTLVEKYPWTDTRITYNHVYTSYRKPCNCTTSCVLSLFTSHNEVINAWSHIFGVILAFGCFLITVATASSDRAKESVILSIFCIGGMFMFSNSALYHIFCSHSDLGSRKVQCLDWLGIAVFTFVTNLLVSYFEIYAFGHPDVFYIFTVVNLFLAFFSYNITYSALQTVYAPFNGSGQGHTKGADISNNITGVKSIWYKLMAPIYLVMNTYVFRTSVGITYALGSFISWIIGYVLADKANYNHLSSIIGLYLCFATVLFCLTDFPEKFFPRGTFDVLVSSSNLISL